MEDTARVDDPRRPGGTVIVSNSLLGTLPPDVRSERQSGDPCEGATPPRAYGSAVIFARHTAALAVLGVAGAVACRMVLRAYTVAVSGPSMTPTLHDGDALVVYPVRRVRAGDVVIARFTSRPDLLVVKRAIRPYRGGWWIEGDNSLVADDSRKYGEAVVMARVLFRYWRAPSGSARFRQGRRYASP